jgi:hypothetical protein
MKSNNSNSIKQSNNGTFSDKVHYGELRRNAKLINDAPTAQGQNLAADKGVNGAQNIMTRKKK